MPRCSHRVRVPHGCQAARARPPFLDFLGFQENQPPRGILFRPFRRRVQKQVLLSVPAAPGNQAARRAHGRRAYRAYLAPLQYHRIHRDRECQVCRQRLEFELNDSTRFE